MRYLIFILTVLLFANLANASDRWFGFNVQLASLGSGSYAMTLYRYNNEVVESDYQIAETKAGIVCGSYKVLSSSNYRRSEMNVIIIPGSYEVISSSFENTKDHKSIDFIFKCTK